MITLIEAGASWICCSKPLAVTTTVSMTLARSSPSAQAEAETPAPAAHSATARRVRKCVGVPMARRDAATCVLLIFLMLPSQVDRRATRAGCPASYDS